MIKSKLRLFGWAVGLSLALGAVGAVVAQGAPVEAEAADNDLAYHLSVGSVASDTAYDNYSNKSVSSSTASSTVSSASWAMTCGSSNGVFGNNSKSGNLNKEKLSAGSFTEASGIATAVGTTTDTTRYAALIGQTGFSNIKKVQVIYSGFNGGKPNQAWVLSSANGSSWTVEATKANADISSSPLEFSFELNTDSLRYALVAEWTNYTNGGGFKGCEVKFIEGAASSDTVTAVSITNGMSTTSYSTDDSWSSAGITTSITTQSGNPWTGAAPTFTYVPATPLAAKQLNDWNGQVAITATVGGTDSAAYNQAVTVSWALGSQGNPYSVAQASSSTYYQQNLTGKYVTGYLAHIDGSNYWLVDDFDEALAGTYTASTSWELYNASDEGLSSASLGDKVTCTGKMYKYSGQYEFSGGTTADITIVSNALSALHAVAADKTYYEGGSIAKSDFTFTVDYGSETGVAISGDDVTITSSAVKYEEGENTVTFSYTERGVTRTVDVVINAEEDTRVPDHIVISGDMDGLSYFDDEEWDETDLSFALVYSDSSSVAIPKDSAFLEYEYQDGEGNPVASPVAGMTEVNVYAYYDDGDFSDEETITLDGFTVTAVEISQLTWTNKNVSYVVGDTLTIKGTLTAEYTKSDYNVSLTMNTTGIEVTLGGVAVTASRVLTLSDHGKALSITYDGLNVTETISVNKVVTVSHSVNQLVDTNGWSTGDNTCYTSFTMDGLVKVSTTGTANCGAIYGTSTYDWRLYQNKNGNVTIAVADGMSSLIRLQSIKFTFTISNSGTLLDGSTALVSEQEYSASGTSKTFTVGGSGTSGQVRITAFEVKVARINTGYVQNWIDANLHFSDVPTSVKDDTGACAGDEGYYLTAKKALVALNTAHDGVIDELKGNTDFADAVARYEAWATNVGDTKPYEGNSIVRGALNIIGAKDNARTPLLVAAFAGVGALAVGGMVFLRKRKEF